MLTRLLLVVVAAGVVSAEDSPLVALSKRTNRKASKTPVITQQTISTRSRLAVGTTPVPPPTAAPAPKTAAVPAAAPNTAATPAAPPAAKVTVAAQSPAYSSTTVRNFEPQSSAQTVAGPTSARTVAPSQTSGAFAPQSTGQTVQPQSTARSVEPQGARPQQ